MTSQPLRKPTLAQLRYWKRDERPGEHGFTWAHYHLLMDEAGNYAIRAGSEFDPVLRKAAQDRERTLDDLGRRLLPFLPKQVCSDCKQEFRGEFGTECGCPE